MAPRLRDLVVKWLSVVRGETRRAAILPIERRARWAEAMHILGKLLVNLLRGAGTLAAVLGNRARMPGPIGLLLHLLGPDLVQEAANMAGDKISEINAQAMETRLPNCHIDPLQDGLGQGEKKRTLLRNHTRSSSGPLVGGCGVFRFHRDGGFPDPLVEYYKAFSSVRGEPEVRRRVGETVALRFPDPSGREDRAGQNDPTRFYRLPAHSHWCRLDRGRYSPCLAPCCRQVRKSVELPKPST